MRRRDLLAAMGNAAALSIPLPGTVLAQQRAVPVVGWLDAREAAAASDDVLAFRKGLSEAGFIDGRNVAIVFRWADTHLDRLPAMAVDLVRQSVAVLFVTNATARIAMTATSTIPIVFAGGGDPIENGLVTSLNHPGGNVTGVSYIAGTLNTKRLQQLHQLVPAPALIAVLFDANNRLLDPQIKAMEDAARVLGRQILVLKVRNESTSMPLLHQWRRLVWVRFSSAPALFSIVAACKSLRLLRARLARELSSARICPRRRLDELWRQHR